MATRASLFIQKDPRLHVDQNNSFRPTKNMKDFRANISVVNHDYRGGESIQSLNAQQNQKTRTWQKRQGNQTNVTRPTTGDLSYLVGQSAKKRSNWQDAFAKADTVLDDGVSSAYKPRTSQAAAVSFTVADKPTQVHPGNLYKEDKNAMRVSRGVESRYQRATLKKPTDRKVKELQGNGNPVYHDHEAPFQMAATGRTKSLASCFGSGGMKDSMDVKFYKNWEGTAPKNKNDSYKRESVNLQVAEKPKAKHTTGQVIGWTKPKGYPLTFQ